MATTSFSDFLENLGAFESGINPQQDYGEHDLDWLQVFEPSKGNVDKASVDLSNSEDLSELQYHVHNTLGFLGKYQFGEPLLIDLGYYTPGPNGFYGSTATNEWAGTFTGKHGVYSKEDFMSEVQELAIREAFAMNMTVIDRYLSQAGKSLDDYLGNEYSYTRFGVEHTATVTMSGILASAHLQGPGGVANLLLRDTASSDEYGTNILFYMDQFGGFDAPFGTSADDVLSGSDYDETFDGEGGNDVYETGGGFDKIIISEKPNGQDTIKDFEIGKDVLAIGQFDGLRFSDLLINDDPSGAKITLPNEQTIILEGVAANDVGEVAFVYGPYTLGWAANTGDTVIENFNAQHDILDFNYAFTVDHLQIYEENGSSVIEVTGNNQRYILEGTPLSELSMLNFVKMPIGFADLFFAASPREVPDQGSGSTVDQPPVDTGGNDDTSDGSDETPPVDSTPPTEPYGDGNMYSFTWSWGAHDVVEGFDANHDVINLQSFWTNYGSFTIHADNNGDAVIDLNEMNQQSITLRDVTLDQLSAQNFSGVTGNFQQALSDDTTPPVDTTTPEEPVDEQPPVDPTPSSDEGGDNGDTVDSGSVYAYTWSWGSDNVIAHFDATQDVVDLSAFWTDYGSFDIYAANNEVVLDLTNLNNQMIRLQGISLDEFSADNVRGVQGEFQQALSDGVVTEPVPDTDDAPTTDDTPPAADETVEHSAIDGDSLVGSQANDVFQFTWQWGSEHIVENFDSSKDVIDLKSFWTTPEKVGVYDDANGNAVVDLREINNQTITLLNVSSDELNDDNLLT